MVWDGYITCPNMYPTHFFKAPFHESAQVDIWVGRTTERDQWGSKRVCLKSISLVLEIETHPYVCMYVRIIVYI